eukprot:jgi/Mesvir1/18670/Mv17169-RA.1
MASTELSSLSRPGSSTKGDQCDRPDAGGSSSRSSAPPITHYFTIPMPEAGGSEKAELVAISHLLLESKLEKMLARAPTVEEQGRTKRLALEWIRQWDLEGDEIVSGLDVKVAALEHAKLQIRYGNRGRWLAILAVIAVCCLFVILGLSVWANDISSDAKVSSSRDGDLGGFTLRKKGSSAVVKTATALYEFRLSRIGFLPFDELSSVTSVTVLHNRALHLVQVAGFHWAGTGNVTFFSPRGVRVAVLRPTANTVRITIWEPGDGDPTVIFDDFEPGYNFLSIIDLALMFLAQQGMPLTIDSFNTITRLRFFRDGYADVISPRCMEESLAFFDRKTDTMDQSCGVAAMLLFQGFGTAQARVGPQDYYGSQLSEDEKRRLTGPAAFVEGNLFLSDYKVYRERFNQLVQSRIDLIQRTM